MNEVTFTVEPGRPDQIPTCVQLLQSLGEWFPIAGAIEEFRRDAARLDTYVARASEDMIGFISLDRQTPRRSLIHVLAVRREDHRRGVGAALIARAEQVCRDLGVRELEVRTMGAAGSESAFKGTRAFYSAMGFRPIEQTLTLWGQANPCLILEKKLDTV